MSKPKPMPSYWALAEEVTHLHGQLDQLKAENAKLQELCRDMLKTIQVMDEEWHSLTDFTTMAEAAETYDFDAENAPEYEEKLRKLGIEVKG